jgi:hypothetical protein
MRYITTVLLFLLFNTSCVSTGPFKQDLGGTRAVITGVGGDPVIIVCRQIDLNANSAVGTLKPGDSVKVLKKTATAALIQLDNGNTGWIDIKAVNNNE